MSVSLTAASLRLKNGGHRCEGRVEVKHQGKWGTVNDYKWSLEEAAVVCRRLGCGAAIDAPQGSYFGPAVGPIWFPFISCTGTESALKQCRHPTVKDYHPQGYSHDHDAGAVCSGKSCLIQDGITSKESLSLIPRVTMRIQITAFSIFLGEDSSHTVIPRALGVEGSRRVCLALEVKTPDPSVTGPFRSV